MPAGPSRELACDSLVGCHARQLRNGVSRHRVNDALAVGRPGERVKHRCADEPSKHSAFAVHEPDTTLSTAIRDEGYLVAIRRERRTLLEDRIRCEGTCIRA